MSVGEMRVEFRHPSQPFDHRFRNGSQALIRGPRGPVQLERLVVPLQNARVALTRLIADLQAQSLHHAPDDPLLQFRLVGRCAHELLRPQRAVADGVVQRHRRGQFVGSGADFSRRGVVRAKLVEDFTLNSVFITLNPPGLSRADFDAVDVAEAVDNRVGNAAAE